MSKQKETTFSYQKLIFFIVMLGFITSLINYPKPPHIENRNTNTLDTTTIFYILTLIKQLKDLTSNKSSSYNNDDIYNDDISVPKKGRVKNFESKSTSKTNNKKSRKINSNKHNELDDKLPKDNIKTSNLTKHDFNYDIKNNFYNKNNKVKKFFQADFDNNYKANPCNECIRKVDHTNLVMDEAIVSDVNIDTFERNTIQGKFPVFINTKTIKFPINIEATVEDKIIEIEKISHKIINFNTKLSMNTDNYNDKEASPLLFYNGVLRTMIKYIYFDRKTESVTNAKYNIIILYTKFNGYSELDLNTIDKKININIAEIKTNLKNSIFHSDYIIEDVKELEETPDTTFNKFIIIGEGTCKLDVHLETYLNVFF